MVAITDQLWLRLPLIQLFLLLLSHDIAHTLSLTILVKPIIYEASSESLIDVQFTFCVQGVLILSPCGDSVLI